MSPFPARRRAPSVRALAAPLLLAALAAVATIAGCGGEPPADAATPPAAVRDTAALTADGVQLAGLTVAPADSSAWRDAWRAPGRLTLDPSETAHLGAIVEGRVTRFPVRVGDRVRRGQVLVALHSHEMMDALSGLAKATAADAQAASALALAEAGAERAQRLHALKALSLAEAERAQGGLAEARAARAQARAELSRARAMHGHLVGAGRVPAGTDAHEVLVRSPMDGVVVGRDAEPGAVVLVGAPLVTVSRARSLVLTTRLPERALGAALPGATVQFTVPAFPDARFTARVTRVAPTLDSVTRTVAVEANVLDGGPRLRAEMYVDAELLGAPGVPVLSVPAAAVQALAGDTVVIVARPQGGGGVLLESVRVRVGRRTAERAEILAGLAPGTPVVTAGAAVARAEILRRRDGA